jgi:hypothetical protein
VAANTPTVAKSTAQTQAGNGTVDTITFTTGGDMLWCDNRSTTVNIWITYSSSDKTPADPTAGGDGCLYVPAGSFRSWPLPAVGKAKVFGDAASMTYVIGVL